jgi:hypothetical protein
MGNLNTGQSKLLEHTLSQGHSFGPVEHIIMPTISEANKCKNMDTVAVFHIYKATKKGIQLKDKHTVVPNPTFDAITLLRGTLLCMQEPNKRLKPVSIEAATTKHIKTQSEWKYPPTINKNQFSF